MNINIFIITHTDDIQQKTSDIMKQMVRELYLMLGDGEVGLRMYFEIYYCHSYHITRIFTRRTDTAMMPSFLSTIEKDKRSPDELSVIQRKA